MLPSVSILAFGLLRISFLGRSSDRHSDHGRRGHVSRTVVGDRRCRERTRRIEIEDEEGHIGMTAEIRSFEYALGLFTVLVDLAIADIALSVHRLIRHRSSVQWDPLALMATLYTHAVPTAALDSLGRTHRHDALGSSAL